MAVLAPAGVVLSYAPGVSAQESETDAVEQDTREAARQREQAADEDPAAARRAARDAERSASEAEGEAGDAEEVSEASSRDAARQREQGADEDPAAVRRAEREAERAAVDSGEESEEEKQLEEAEQRELGAEKDPLEQEAAEREAEREAFEAQETAEQETSVVAPGKERKYAEKVEHKPVAGETGIDIYGSLRLRYRGQDGDGQLEDGGSRAGVDYEWQFNQGSYLFGRYEAGFNVLTEVGGLVNPGENAGEESDSSFFTRLAYVGIDTPVIAGVIGKNWSSYYKVAAFTDRFMGTGASASGAFNAQTDGGPTGPGRADGAVQSQFRIDFLPQKFFKPFDLNVQVQDGNTIPFSENVDYGTAVGVSAVMTTQKDFTVGVAYNHATVDIDANPSLRTIGIRGNARAALIGTRAFGDRWYAGLVVSRLENHETTDDGIYFDGWGSEFYGQYRLLDRLWLTGGYNILEPDSDQVLAREYQVKYAVVGFRYTFDDFRRMLYANIRYDDSINADGTTGANVFTVGIRWDLTKRGWHTKSGVDEPPPEAK